MMGKNKTALIIIVSVIGLSVLLFFLPVNRLVGSLPFINQFYNNTTLEILTKRGKARVWIDGKEYGETPTTVDNLPEGTYSVELERIEEGDSFYERETLQVDLTRNTSARIDLEIGPDNLLHGSLLYYTPVRTSSKEGFLTIISNVSHARIFVDGEFLKATPITNLGLKESQYNIKVIATGYEDVEIPILVRDNYTLNLKTFHFPIPVTFDTLEGQEEASIEVENEEIEEVEEITEDTNE
jgi:hypothetical protein